MKKDPSLKQKCQYWEKVYTRIGHVLAALGFLSATWVGYLVNDTWKYETGNSVLFPCPLVFDCFNLFLLCVYRTY